MIFMITIVALPLRRSDTDIVASDQVGALAVDVQIVLFEGRYRDIVRLRNGDAGAACRHGVDVTFQGQTDGAVGGEIRPIRLEAVDIDNGARRHFLLLGDVCSGIAGFDVVGIGGDAIIRGR